MEEKNIYDRFNKEVMQTVIFAKAASINAKVDCIYPESFAIGILYNQNIVTSILDDLGVNMEKCLEALKKELVHKRSRNESNDNPEFINLNISRQLFDACKMAGKISSDMKNTSIGVHHLFMALLKISKPLCNIMEEQGLDISECVDMLSKVKESKEVEPEKEDGEEESRMINKKKKSSALESYCIDVTEQAKAGKLDPIIAREKEIEMAITILCRRTKNNPILVGYPGVGKTAVVEGIAQRIVAGTVPSILKGNKIYSLSVANIVAGTKYRGQFEERMQKIVKEIKGSDNYILFIDEIHTLVGAGGAGGSALDASNILKPYLARGELRCLGATTLEDYKKYFKKDGALVRRFQKIDVDEPTREQTHQILAGIKTGLEKFHKCIISDNAIDAAIRLSERYLTDRRFPDKSIDCLDIACAKHVWDGSKSSRVITMGDIAEVVSEQCQIPIEVILWDDNERLKRIEESISLRVIGQNNAVDTVCRVLKNAWSGIRNPDRPIGSFVFGGQTGTGKTYMAEELAKAVFGKESYFVRLDMTEFAEAHTVSKLIGSPPGYVGFSETDLFIDKIRRRPYCVVLLDEIEKAHPDVVRTFLQVMSYGTMNDAEGNKVNFRNVILIMTGNFGMNEPAKAGLGFSPEKQDKSLFELEQERLIKFCKEAYGEEFINRVDDFVPFLQLNSDDLKKIAAIQFGEIKERLVGRPSTLKFDDSTADLLVKLSEKEHGKNATLLKRLISKSVEPVISDALLSCGNKSYYITITAKDGKFSYTKRVKREKKNE